MGIRAAARETILGFTFWCVYQGLPPMIWFYPLNELEITGYEAFALVCLSPLLLGIGPLRRLLTSRVGLSVLRLAVVGCLASYQASYTHHRLIILAAGVFLHLIVLAASLWHDSPKQRCESVWGLMLGLLAFIVSRIWFVSFIPTWWNDHCNSVVIALAALATVDKILSASSSDKVPTKSSLSVSSRSDWFITALGCGALLCITHTFFGEVSIVTRWVVRPYPDAGPQPNPSGLAVLVSLCLGLLLGTVCPCVASSIIWWVIGAASLAAVYLLPTWQGFTGGLVLAVYVMSLWPVMLDRLTSVTAVARVLTISVIIHYALLFYSVWTIAYNFVPGGEYTREHTGWALIFMAACLALATLTMRGYDKSTSNSSFIMLHVPNASLSLGVITFSIIALLCAGITGFAVRQDAQRYSHPAKTHPQADFSAAIWTYHFGYDNKGWPSLERSATLLRDTGADVITLLESDASKPFLGNNDLGMWLGEKLGMYVDYGPSTKDHTWGNLILSKYPFVKSEHLLLPSPEGELAPAVVATVNMTGLLVDFVVTHMGNDRDVQDRKLQAQVLAQKLDKAENPVVFLGYVTSAPGSRDYKTLTGQGRVKDIDADDTDRWCEYIMYRGLIRLGYARISHGGLSDTEVQVGRFRIPEDSDKFQDNTKTVTNPESVPKGVRFNERFGKFRAGHNWATKHEFHMSTPKYFIKA